MSFVWIYRSITAWWDNLQIKMKDKQMQVTLYARTLAWRLPTGQGKNHDNTAAQNQTGATAHFGSK